MTTSPASLSPESDRPAPPLGPTLADVLDRVPDLPVPPQARRNMASALRTLCRVLDRPPALVPAAAKALRAALDRAAPGAVGVSAARWRNVRSDAGRAIRLAGLATTVRLADEPLTDAWEAVARRAPTATQRSILRRFGRFCSGRQRAPSAVGEDDIRGYAAFLDDNLLSKTPERSVKDLVRTWNRFVAADPAEPFAALAPRNASRAYTLAWADLPADLAADAARFKAASLRSDPLPADPFGDLSARRPVRPSTAAQRDRMLRRLATAELLAGVPRDALDGLGALVHPDHLKPGLRFLLDRSEGQPNRQLFEMAFLARLIARHWARLPEAQVATITTWVRNVAHRQEGMTEKNRERLRQFADRQVIGRFLTLPDRLVAEARRRPVDSRAANRVQTALAIAVLTVAPLRLGNLLALDRTQHFQRAFSVDDPALQLVIPRGEVKNAVDLRFPVPERIRAMLDLYMETYQPVLAKRRPSSLLFPGRAEGPMCDSALRRKITEAIRETDGLHVHPHLFRHLAALLYLKCNPGQYESVRQLLGHKHLQTTITFYAGFLTDPAMELYAGVIEDLRQPEAPRPRRAAKAR